MDALSAVDWPSIVYALMLLVVGFLVAKRSSNLVDKTVTKRFSRHQAMLARRLVFYSLFIIFFISALKQLGFQMSVLLGAAGVFTVAISFASQTAASNLISGIFLIFERPFKVGDVISVKGAPGTVESLDLLSTKIKTFEGTLLRIPNEMLMKSEIVNMSYFPKRRVEILIGVAYDCDVEQVKTLFLALLNSEKGVLTEPEPQVFINQFADSSVELKVMAWVRTKEFAKMRNRLREQIKIVCDKESIEIPFPQLTIHQD